ncbi:hypothetical protein FSST1_009737 [Fusarium sambucinum]
MARSKRQRCHGSGDKDGNSPKRLSTASVSAAPAGCPTFVDLTYSEGDSDEFSVIASRQIRQEAIYCISDEDDDLPGRHSTISGSKSHVRTGAYMDLTDPEGDANPTNDMSISRVRKEQHETICYGAIFDVFISLCYNTKIPEVQQPWDRYCLVDVHVDDMTCFLSPKLRSKKKQPSFLDERAGLTLAFISKQAKHVSFAAAIGANVIHGQLNKSTKQTIKATVNIYGPKHLMGKIYQALAELKSYLQHPVFLQPDIPYINPQFLYSTGEKTDLRHLVGPKCEDITSDASRSIDGVMDGLDDWDDDLPAERWSMVHFRPELDQYLVTTDLKDHQLQGVEFILRREDPDVAVQINKKMLMSIDHCLTLHPKTSGLGGILADVMGLGKTLTMLSAILCSRQLRQKSGIGGSHIGETRRCNLTLIVLPSRLLLDVWKYEIDKHFRPQTFKTQIFHGQTRAKNSDQLLNSDIVLTTYHTLEKDYNDKKILNDIRWSRVVLDEAHYIRNSSIKIHKAALVLQSDARWCLTGTPIQNSLDDLRSLMQFLQFEPLCQSKTFEKHILKPFRNESNDCCTAFETSQNLKFLLKACCRRTVMKPNLPTTSVCKVPVTAIEVEKAMFKTILDECREEFDLMAGKGKESKKSNILFSSIMKLRRVCNHGTIKINDISQNRSNELPLPKMQINPSYKSTSETACDFCSNAFQENDFLVAIDSCPLCNRHFPEGNSNIRPAAVSPQSMGSRTDDAMDIDSPEPPNNNSGLILSTDRVREQSSKMSAVVDNIRESCLGSNSKSVVFSSWRDTLDILAAMLIYEGIPFIQVDGRNPLLGRTELLLKFRQDPDLKVLLISINTGAVGLTLTEANIVHIVEPQWNPTIEEQAIARVVRMGQMKPVTVYKYIVNESVEQSVLKLQERKTQIIKLSVQDKYDDETGTNLDRFKFAIDPNEWKSDY